MDIRMTKINYRIFSELQMGVAVFLGANGIEAIQEFVRDIFKSLEHSQIKFFIYDFRDTDFIFNPKEIYSLISELRWPDKIPCPISVFVSSKPKETAFCYLFNIILKSNNKGNQIYIYSHISEAIKDFHLPFSERFIEEKLLELNN